MASPSRKVVPWVVGSVLLLAAVLALYTWAALSWSYSAGERVGYVQKFSRKGWLSPGQPVHAVAKYHFYNEYFNIVEYQDASGKALGYYCDIVTPLHRSRDEYFLTDLILDLWISPDLQVVELDRDEFEAAVAQSMLPPALERHARMTISQLRSEIAEGRFPARYLA